jgi:hypothetical protein
VADFVICPRCRRQNPADSIFCNRCGVRLLNAGVYYNRRDGGSNVGMGQLLLGLGVLILAGLVLGGGAIVLLGAKPSATPTHIAAGPTPTGQASNSSPSPSGIPLPTQTLFFTLPPTPTLIATGSPSAQPTITPEPTPLPTATPIPTPAPTPVDCAVASQGTNVRNWQLGLGHDAAKPLGKTWCIRSVAIGGWQGWGTAKLMIKNTVIYQQTCLPPGHCSDSSQDFVPPYQAAKGKLLKYTFECFNDILNSCSDATPDGAVITISYEGFEGP